MTRVLAFAHRQWLGASPGQNFCCFGKGAFVSRPMCLSSHKNLPFDDGLLVEICKLFFHAARHHGSNKSARHAARPRPPTPPPATPPAQAVIGPAAHNARLPVAIAETSTVSPPTIAPIVPP